MSLGLIRACREPVVKVLYPSLQLDRVSVLQFVGRLAEVLEPPVPDCVALEDLFHGIGGQEKPWGAIISAALGGHIPGGLGQESAANLRFERLTVSRRFAGRIALWRASRIAGGAAQTGTARALGRLSRLPRPNDI